MIQSKGNGGIIGVPFSSSLNSKLRAESTGNNNNSKMDDAATSRDATSTHRPSRKLGNGNSRRLAVEKELDIFSKKQKELLQYLSDWTETFTETYGRTPSLDDKLAVPEIYAKFEENKEVSIDAQS